MTFPAAHPAVVGSITFLEGLPLLAEPVICADLVEVRVDALMSQGVPEERIEVALEERLHPVLLTLRIPEEGGRNPWHEGERAALYRRFLPMAEAIDVELASAVELAPVVKEALAMGKTVILSAHAFNKPAPAEQFDRWLAAHAQHDTKTILKIAAHIDSWRDLQRLAALLVNNPEKQIAAMGLGPHAPQSRAILAALGSRLVYGWLDEPAAPGQPAAAAMREMIDTLPPRES